jgi:hypothetical protein
VYKVIKVFLAFAKFVSVLSKAVFALARAAVLVSSAVSASVLALVAAANETLVAAVYRSNCF